MIDNLQSVLKKINNIVNEQYASRKQLGLCSGLSGAALFQFYYSRYTQDNEISNSGIDILGECISQINNGYIYPTFCDGFAGLTWLFDHLEQQNFIDLDTIDLDSFDNYLYNSMLLDFDKKNYDFLHGAIGYTVYFLERFKNSKQENKLRYKSYIESFIEFLENSSVRGEKGIMWLSKDYETGNEVYNLGLSHGVASIIGILNQLCDTKEFSVRCSPLLMGAVNELLNYKNDIELFPSYFPSWISFSSQEYYKKSRLGWCYGDLGIGLQLFYTSKILKNTDLETESIEILTHCATRRSPEQTSVDDGAVCHGAFGNALIFNNIYVNTGKMIFREARDYWLEKGIELSFEDDKLLKIGQNELKEISLLTGVAGIGLSIISCLSDLNKWENSIMLYHHE